jgi:hypothetical protein
MPPARIVPPKIQSRQDCGALEAQKAPGHVLDPRRLQTYSLTTYYREGYRGYSGEKGYRSSRSEQPTTRGADGQQGPQIYGTSNTASSSPGLGGLEAEGNRLPPLARHFKGLQYSKPYQATSHP